MASEGLECSICCEHFDEEKLCPRLLSCGHSFCTSCLEKMFKEYAINCPTCRSAVSVPAGVTRLPKNFALLDILQAAPHRDTPADGNGDLRLCEVCDDEQHSATSYCLDCKWNMCKDAARWHSRQKVTREHCVVSLDELKENPLIATIPVFCPEHNEQYLFFDEKCSHVVCKDCVVLKHNGHKFLSLAEAASKYRQEMEGLATKASTHAEEIQAAETRVAYISRDLNKAYEEKASQIKGAFKELHAALTAREQVLLNELEQLHKTKSFTLTEQRDRLRTFQACLKSAAQRTMSIVQSSGNTEVLVARSDIVATLGAMDSQSLMLEPQADCVLEFRVNLVGLLNLLNDAGIVTDTSACPATTTAEGSGLNWAMSGREDSFTITAHDAEGRPCDVGGDLFTVELTQNGGGKLKGKVKDNGDGTYMATYTSQADSEGNQRLSVTLRGTHIKGSPFAVNVTYVPVGKISCSSCRQQTKTMMYFYRAKDIYYALCYPKCFNFRSAFFRRMQCFGPY